MDQYRIVWQRKDGVTREMLVYAESAEAARKEFTANAEKEERIVSCKKTGVQK